MTIRFGPQGCGTLDESALREWLVADGAGGYAMGTVGGLRTRRYHGLLAVAVDGPGSRMLGLVSLDPVLVLGDARVRLATHEWGAGTVDPSGYELLVSFDLEDGVPRWRWQLGGVVFERELAMAHGSPTVGVVHRLVAADRPVTLELAPLCTWRSVHGERFGTGDPQVEMTDDGFVFEGAYRVAGRRVRARRRVVSGRAGARGGRPRPERPRGPLGGRNVQGRAPAGRLPRGDRLGGAARRRAARRRRDRLRRPGPRRGRDPRCRRHRFGRRAARPRGRPVRDHDRGPPDGRGRLPVVRRVVARPDDVLRGPLPVDRPRRRGSRGAPDLGRDRVRGDAREHRRHGLARVQHRRRHALVRPCRRPPRLRHRRHRPRPRAGAGARHDRPAPPRRHPLRHRRGHGRRPAPSGRRGLGAHVDGRARRRAADHPARRQAGRGQRSVAPRARRCRGPRR